MFLCVEIVYQQDSSQQHLCPITFYCYSQRYRLFITVVLKPPKLVLHVLRGVSVHACFSVSLYVLVCPCISSTCLNPLNASTNTIYIYFYPFFHVLDSWHLSTMGSLTSKDILMRAPPQPQFPFFFLCFHCEIKLNTAFHLLRSSLEMEA